jgi:hypothetical protein
VGRSYARRATAFAAARTRRTYDARDGAGEAPLPADEVLPMRWILLAATALSVLLCCTRHSGGAMAAWLLLAILGSIATVFAFAQARIDASAREETLSDYDLARLREGKPTLNDR